VPYSATTPYLNTIPMPEEQHRGSDDRAATGRAAPRWLVAETTERIIGCDIVGPTAGELIAVARLASEMGTDASDSG